MTFARFAFLIGIWLALTMGGTFAQITSSASEASNRRVAVDEPVLGCGVVASGSLLAAKGGAGARGNGLPVRGGPPDGTMVRDTGHGTGTIRDYDVKGNAKTDYDFHGGEAAGNPHAHDWDWGQTPPRGPARPLKPGE